MGAKTAVSKACCLVALRVDMKAGLKVLSRAEHLVDLMVVKRAGNWVDSTAGNWVY